MGVPEDSLGNRAQQEPLDPMVTMGGDDNEARFHLCGVVGDIEAGIAQSNLEVAPHQFVFRDKRGQSVPGSLKSVVFVSSDGE
jgi:hypothetical protein